MFAKLKQKIQEEDLSKKQQSSSSPIVNSSRTTIDVDQERTSRAAERDAVVNSQASFSITDSPTSPARTNNVDASTTVDNRPRSPRSVAELTKSLSEERRLREKLQSMLEKQQDAQSRRIEEKESEWRNKLEKLEKDSAEWRHKFEETSPWKERYIRDHEAVEELEGFQVQELSKVKHLLLISQQELQERTIALKERDADLSAMRSTCFGLNDELTHLKGMCERLEDERAKKKSHSDDESISELRELNVVLSGRLSDISRQLEEKESQAGSLQRELADLRDEHASLKHTHEVQTKRDRGLLDAKDSDIAHLESRLLALERRLADVDLGDDDRLANVSTERDSLEAKLDECRQHLSEVKTTWMERIESLETQIAHLNAKMAEDSEEAARCETSNRQMREEIARLNGELRESKEALERQRLDLTDQMQNALQQKEMGSNSLLKRIADFETRLSSANDERERLTSTHNAQLNHLEELRLDELRLKDHQKGELLAENDLLKERSEQQESEISQLKQNIEDLQSQMESIRSVEARVRDDLSQLEAHLKETTQERNALQERIDGRVEEDEVAANEKEESRAKLEATQAEMEQLRLMLQTTEDEMEGLRKTIVDLESTANASQVENSKLNTTVALLEVQLADRNKAAKLQRQRLGDMKKTLQRELQAAGRPLSAIVSAAAMDGTDADPSVENNVDVQHWSSIAAQHSSSSTNHLGGSMGRMSCSSLADKLDDINFRYVKHVILKFMTSTEYEAHQLIKAIGVLLEFSRDEERLVRDTLNWKASWFGTKPQQGATRSRVGNRTVI